VVTFYNYPMSYRDILDPSALLDSFAPCGLYNSYRPSRDMDLLPSVLFAILAIFSILYLPLLEPPVPPLLLSPPK